MSGEEPGLGGDTAPVTALPMFPLGTVLLPSLVLPLHVFEARYRALVEHCINEAVEPEFGVVLIERGSEVGGGDIRSMVGTVARIVEAARTADGRWALGAVGTRRVRVVRWLEDDPYPRAEVVDWPDAEPGPGFDAQIEACVRTLRRVLALASEAGDDVVAATIELSDDPVLCAHQAVAVSPLGPIDRQRLLAAPSPEERVTMLQGLLDDELHVLRQRIALDASSPDED